MTYKYSKSMGGFFKDEIHGDKIPADAVEISDNTHKELIDAQSQGKQITADSNGSPIAVDPESLLTSEQITKDRIFMAKQLLLKNDYRWNNQIKWSEYSDETKNKIINYYKNLVAVVNGESETIPTFD